MKKKIIVAIVFMICATVAVAFEQPTFVGLQGRVTDSIGVPVNNGNLRATVSTSPSCEQNIIYDYTYNGVVRAGLFSVLLGNDSNLNLTYNRDYYLCTYINGEVQRNLGGFNTTKFRGGQGIIGAGNLTNGTFATGNYTFADNLTLGAWLLVKNDEDYIQRVLRAPIKYKDLVDRSANENITGNWSFLGITSGLSDINNVEIKAGSKLIDAATTDTVMTWQPAEGEVWQITKMMLNIPYDDLSGAHKSYAEVFISNSTDDVSLYKLETTITDNNIMLLLSNEITQSSVTTADLSQGLAPLPNSGDDPNVILEDTLYISNTNYLKIKMKTGDPSAQTGRWWVQGLRKT